MREMAAEQGRLPAVKGRKIYLVLACQNWRIKPEPAREDWRVIGEVAGTVRFFVFEAVNATRRLAGCGFRVSQA